MITLCNKTKVSFGDLFKIPIAIITFVLSVYSVESNGDNLAETQGHQDVYNIFLNI